MAYIGKQPTVGNFVKLDAITTSATTTFNLTNGGVAYSPQSPNHCIVSLNGVIQSPNTSFTISGSTIVFASALTSSDVIDFILVLGDVLNIGTPSDATVGFSKITSNLITGATAETSIAGGDQILIYDDSASALRKMTRTNFTKGVPTIQTFTSGSGTYTTPSGATYIIVNMVGAGGGGGGGGDASAGFGAGGGGGGAGAYVKKILSSPSSTYSYAIGSAGTSSAKNVTGGTGGNTTFGSLTANGGSGGGAGGGVNTIGSGGTGGAGSGGDLNLTGGDGFLGTVGASGSTQGSGGSGGQNQLGNSSRSTGLSYGGGGAGGGGASSSSAGAAGFIIVTEYYN